MPDGDRKFARSMVCFIAGALLVPPIARATAKSLINQEFDRWKLQDKCVADAVTAHPDRDVASQRARDLFVDACLEKKHLPPRAHIAPPDDPTQAAAPPPSPPPPTDKKPGDAPS